MAIVKETANNKYWKGVEKREPLHTIAWSVNWYSHYGIPIANMEVPQKSKNRIKYDPAVPLLGI